MGNYPGLTVDILEREVVLPSGETALLCDLPGLYSIEATVDSRTDEGVARDFIDRVRQSHRPFLVVQVVDPTRLALGLRLTRELLDARVPIALALTHKDVLAAHGHEIDVAALTDTLEVPVVVVDARNEGAKRAVLAAVDERLRRLETPRGSTKFDPTELARTVVRDVASDRERQRRRFTERLDRVLLHPFVGPVLFLSLMALTFAAVFVVADPTTALLDGLVTAARVRLDALLGDGLLASFLGGGVLGGAGTVLAFMPQIVILTIALELLESSGYLARGAFLVDRLLRLLGLSGRSFVPLLMGHACAVPAISATRIIRDPRERLTTILVLPLMTCSARLPTYGLVLSAFFSHRSALFRAGLFVTLYFAGILSGLLASVALRRTAMRGKGLPLVLEMPAYRMPQARVIAAKAFRAARRFLRDVGTTIVVVASVLWLLLTIPMPGATANGPAIERSVAASVGRALEPVTRPAGFDWRINVGLIGSFGARELMVGTMGVIFGIDDAESDPAPLTARLREARNGDGSTTYTTRTGLALLAFFVLACQCMSTVAAIRRETGSLRWPAFVLAYTYAFGYAAAVLVYQLSGLVWTG